MSRPSQAVPVTEAQAERAVVELFTWHGCEVRRIREDIHVGTPGLPDLLITDFCVQLWVEMKRPPSRQNPQGRVRKKQKEILVAWRRHAVPCCVADGVDSVERLASLLMLLRPGAPIGPVSIADLLAECDAIMASYEWWPAR